jgi:hypothetical protein
MTALESEHAVGYKCQLILETDPAEPSRQTNHTDDSNNSGQAQ